MIDYHEQKALFDIVKSYLIFKQRNYLVDNKNTSRTENLVCPLNGDRDCFEYEGVLDVSFEDVLTGGRPHVDIDRNVNLMGTYDQDEAGMLKAYTRFDIQIDSKRLARTNAFFTNIRNNQEKDIHNFRVYDCNRDINPEALKNARSKKQQKEGEEQKLAHEAIQAKYGQSEKDLQNLHIAEKMMNQAFLDE